MAGGRPTKYTPEVCEEVIKHFREGASLIEVAYFMNVNKSTIYEWMDKNPEFSSAVKKGIDFSEGWWTAKGRNNIENKDFNSVLWYMNMKNRFKWKDRQETHHEVIVRQEDAIKELE